MTSILQEIIELLVGGLTQIATGVGNGLSTLVEKIFLNADKSGLSTYGGVIIIFAGMAFSISLCSRVVAWITTLGN
jgi:hypothetical protein